MPNNSEPHNHKNETKWQNCCRKTTTNCHLHLAGAQGQHPTLGKPEHRQSASSSNQQRRKSTHDRNSSAQETHKGSSTHRHRDGNTPRIPANTSNQKINSHRGGKNKAVDTHTHQGKERLRKNTTDHRPEGPEPVPLDAQAQNRHLENPPGNSTTAGSHNPNTPTVGNDTGHKEFFPPPAGTPVHTTMDEVQSGEPGVSNTGTAFWMGPQPMVGTEINKTTEDVAERTEHTTLLVCGRHTDSLGDSRNHSNQNCSSGQATHQLWSETQPQKNQCTCPNNKSRTWDT